MKTCTFCKTTKTKSLFSKHKNGYEGLRSYCKVCEGEYNRQYHATNAEKIRERKRSYQLQHYYNNKEQYFARNAKRRADLLHATPSWLTTEDFATIQDFFLEAKYFNYDVDHIFPLRGKLVCGLHVPSNLQIISHTENVKKNNKYEVV